METSIEKSLEPDAAESIQAEAKPISGFGFNSTNSSFSQLKKSSEAPFWMKEEHIASNSEGSKFEETVKDDHKLVPVTICTGEEEENTVASFRAKLYFISKDKSEWTEKGSGTVKINEDANGSRRLSTLKCFLMIVMRSDGTLKVLQNLRLLDIIDPKIHPSLNKALIFGVIENDSPVSYMIKVTAQLVFNI